MSEQREKITYDPDSNILSIELSDAEITNAREMKNVVVHLSEHRLPVLIEVLEASNILPQAEKFLAKKGKHLPNTEAATG